MASLPQDFTEWGEQDATSAIAQAVNAQVGTAGFKANQKFIVERDHWQQGAGWVGPDGGSNADVRSQVLTNVFRQFTPVDVIGEVLDRVVSGVAKREAEVRVTPTTEAQEGSAAADGPADEADALSRQLATWWDRVGFWQVVKEAIRHSRWAVRGPLRLWVPSSNLTSAADGTRRLPSGLTFDEALARIEVEAPAPDQAHVYRDPDTRQECGIVVTQDAESGRSVELWTRTPTGAKLRMLGAGEGEYEVPGLTQLPVLEMTAPLLITEPVRRQQNALNFVNSMGVRVAETAGFAERYTLNAASSGIWSTSADPENPGAETLVKDGVTYYLHEMPRALGASVTTELVGIQTEDGEGNKTLATPGVVFKEPTDPEFAIKSAEHARRTILESCKQAHVVLRSTGEASGVAYQQARSDFEDDLSATAAPTEKLVREALTAVVQLAAAMSGIDAKALLAKLKIEVTCHVHTGPVTPDEANANASLVEKGLLAPETAMARNGIEDPAGELARIRAHSAARAALLTTQAAALQALTDAAPGLDLGKAAKLIGMDDEAIALLAMPRDPAMTQVVEQ